jgi:hypothetical protein
MEAIGAEVGVRASEFNGSDDFSFDTICTLTVSKPQHAA